MHARVGVCVCLKSSVCGKEAEKCPRRKYECNFVHKYSTLCFVTLHIFILFTGFICLYDMLFTFYILFWVYLLVLCGLDVEIYNERERKKERERERKRKREGDKWILNDFILPLPFIHSSY
jgi:hypothetical protein